MCTLFSTYLAKAIFLSKWFSQEYTLQSDSLPYSSISVLGCPLDLFPPRLQVGEIVSSTRDEVVYRCKPGYDGGDPERDVIILCVDNNWIEHNNRCIRKSG